jgi:hypothetical protein
MTYSLASHFVVTYLLMAVPSPIHLSKYLRDIKSGAISFCPMTYWQMTYSPTFPSLANKIMSLLIPQWHSSKRYIHWIHISLVTNWTVMFALMRIFKSPVSQIKVVPHLIIQWHSFEWHSQKLHISLWHIYWWLPHPPIHLSKYLQDIKSGATSCCPITYFQMTCSLTFRS